MEGLLHYINPAHAISLLSHLNEQRLKGHLCDVVLIVGDQKFRAHKSVLAASSEYFQTLFTRKDSEARGAVQLDFCEPDAFENVLNYVYSSSLFVERDGLAAVQELGYSLGIPFLTNILSKKPHVSYSGTRKRASFCEEDDNGSQQRSVIVCQSRGDKPGPSASQDKGPNPASQAASNPFPPVKPKEVSSGQPARESSQPWSKDRGSSVTCEKPSDTSRNTPSTLRKSTDAAEGPDRRPSRSGTLVRGRSPTRPQLTASLSFNDSCLQQGGEAGGDVAQGQDRAPTCLAKQGLRALPGRAGQERQGVDRSGPLIKSLLRRSLSMDSPVPVCSPAFDLKSAHSREEAATKPGAETAAAAESVEGKRFKDKSNVVPPLSLRSGILSRYREAEVDKSEVRVKTEPSSPLADPSEIIRVTVGDNLPVNFRDFHPHANDEAPRGFSKHSVKRKSRLDNRRNQFKKSRCVEDRDFGSELSRRGGATPHNSDTDEDAVPAESRQNRMFKCWSCLKIFRSNTGLYRHVNMYHNPEKPYSCDICHKRFHTNFKVWTHCQTQHGVVKNPAPVSSSYSVLDEKFQRKLIDIVREREIKKALMVKLRRNKPGLGGLQSQAFGKRSLRARSKSYACGYCGKVFWFQSQYKQHFKTHAGAKPDAEGREGFSRKQDEGAGLKESQGRESFPCRLCSEKLPSPAEQGEHERECRHATVCSYCSLRFSTLALKKEHEDHCEYKKLTCLECMRTFKSSFSIWRHQVEVHNQNTMTIKEQLSLSLQEHNGEAPDPLRPSAPGSEPKSAGSSKEEAVFSDSSEPPQFDSEDSSFLPEDLSVPQRLEEVRVKEEPPEEAAVDEAPRPPAEAGPEESCAWPCEKCGKLFTARKQLERHQELLCHVKPFICHICNKAFRTNFRLWSHFQSHVSASEEPGPAAAPGPRPKRAEGERSGRARSSKAEAADDPLTPQESDTLFYHAPTLSALTFKRQYMCKLCHRTFKTAFSLWSHEQSHTST
nr:PREDICTED: zinc finger and BTB domain-containing protein 21 [Lepisosteus oculatus]